MDTTEKPFAWSYQWADAGGVWRDAVRRTDPQGCYRYGIRNVEGLFKHPPDTKAAEIIRKAAARIEQLAASSAHKIIEAADCIGVRGATWALTIEWPDGTETVEHVSDQGARALGYVPDDGEG